MQFVHPLDGVRKSFNRSTDRAVRSQFGQFLTPSAIAYFMSSMFEPAPQEIRLLDPGAGAGVLFAACVANLVSKKNKPNSINIVAYETDVALLAHLGETMKRCESLCTSSSIKFQGVIKNEDFIAAAISETKESLFSIPGTRFTHIILNPPYKKVNRHTDMGEALYSSEIEVANLYAAFVWLSALMLEPNGQMVAITPRSFCNGPYFKKFRAALLGMVNFKRVHLFESRNKAFGDDNVLQENIIYHAVKNTEKPRSVAISVSDGIEFNRSDAVSIPYDIFVRPGDRDLFIHLGGDNSHFSLSMQTAPLNMSLKKLSLEVSTGRVVDFRVKDYLRETLGHNSVPLIYPCHFVDGFVAPQTKPGKKPGAIISSPETSDLLVEPGFYVLVKRFSSKEQPRRIMAAVFDPARFGTSLVGFENHVNYIHKNGKGLPAVLAKGLAFYLNSTVADNHFRLFSGHTQVNAADLRKMPFPSYDQLLRLGSYVGDKMPNQETIDGIIKKEC